MFWFGTLTRGANSFLIATNKWKTVRNAGNTFKCESALQKYFQIWIITEGHNTIVLGLLLLLLFCYCCYWLHFFFVIVNTILVFFQQYLIQLCWVWEYCGDCVIFVSSQSIIDVNVELGLWQFLQYLMVSNKSPLQ